MALSPLARWIRYRTVAYLRGKGVIFGADAAYYPQPATDLGRFALYADVVKHEHLAICDSDLAVVADDSLRYVFLGKRFAELPNQPYFLKQAVGKLQAGGHVIFASPTPLPRLTELLSRLGSWQTKDTYLREGVTVAIFKKLRGTRGVLPTKPRPPKRACVCRYGAMGDMIMVTPLLRALHEDGYHVTVNCTEYSAATLNNNPFVDNLLIQEKDAIPNHDLGEYWDEWKGDYDKYINLSESIEGTLLKVEGRRDFYTHACWRRERCNKNYYDFTLALGGYPNIVGKRGELYFTDAELRDARKIRSQYHDKRLVLWALNGSSYHKIYGLFAPVVGDWLDANPNVVVMTLGDERARAAEFDHPQVIRMAGNLPIRVSLALIQFADLVVGPESVMTNAAGCFDTPKVILMSHSTPEALAKYFTNCWTLEPDRSVAPCYPCFQLHYSRESCPLVSIVSEKDDAILATGPVCAMGAITGERLIATLDAALSATKQPTLV